jgi:hypothetical protein
LKGAPEKKIVSKSTRNVGKFRKVKTHLKFENVIKKSSAVLKKIFPYLPNRGKMAQTGKVEAKINTHQRLKILKLKKRLNRKLGMKKKKKARERKRWAEFLFQINFRREKL